MMKWIVILFLEFFIIYFEVQILVICNNHEFDVGMNGNVKFVETLDMNSEHMREMQTCCYNNVKYFARI
jgi:hypothetical protein